jgi:predicted dehydrogenase
MENKFNIGLIGVGHLGRVHLNKLQIIDDINFYGFYDIDREKSETVATETGAHSAESVDEILENCDIISVVVPTSEHYKVGSLVLNAGRHMFMEKPITEFTNQAIEIVEMAESRDLKLGVGHIERFNPAVQAVQGKLGSPVFIEAHRLNPFNPRGLDVAVILELMIHDIDLCLHFTGCDVVDIQASAVKVLSDKMDIANARLTFESGCVANLTASRISPAGMRKIRVFQKDNYLSFDLKSKTVDTFSLVDQNFDDKKLDGFSTSFEYWETGKKIVYHKPQSLDYDMIETELRHFIQSVADNTIPPVSGCDGLKALEIALEIEKKALESLEKMNSNL